MGAALTRETSLEKTNRAEPVHVSASFLSSEHEQGAMAGMPLFLQASFIPGSRFGFSQRHIDDQESYDEEPFIQTKLAIGQRGDAYEQEADSVAQQVMRLPESPLQTACACGGGCSSCQNEQATYDHLQTAPVQANDSGEMAAPASVHDVVHSSGEPLGADTREFMEPRFGQDFNQVRVHADGDAANAARAVQARAYTIGRDIVFGDGHYQPSTRDGKLLLAHELTHVMQQTGTSAEVAHRQADESPTSRGAGTQGESGATERLRAIIADIERVQANANRSRGDAETQEGGEPQSNEHAEKITDFLEQLRAVASGNDEELKLRVLAGFSSQGLKQAEAKLAEPNTTVREQRPESVAAKTLAVSHPQDAAEVEADRVAQAVVQGSQATVTQTAQGGLVSRQSEALAAAGASILVFQAETLPLTAWNPPGWVINGLEDLAALTLLGIAMYMAAPGNVADTGILEEVERLIQAAIAVGAALTMCAALAQLMAAAERARDTRRIQRIKATQKAKGCRHSRHS